MARLNRERYMLFGRWKSKGETENPWEAIGKDNDELTKELNPDTESGKNVLGEKTFVHSGNEPEVDVDPYYMDPTRPMYQHMLDVALEEKFGEDDLLGEVAEAFFEEVNAETKTMSGYCYVYDAWFVPQSVGGDTKGFSISYNINPVGGKVRKSISYAMATNTATITDITGDDSDDGTDDGKNG